MNQPDARYINSKEQALFEPYAVTFILHGERFKIVIPKGYIFSASVPRIFWWFINPGGLITGAAAVHDWLYQNRGDEIAVMHENFFKKWNMIYREFTRSEADEIFKEIMKQSGMPMPEIKNAYRTVRTWGWTYWMLPKKPIRYYNC